MLQRVLHAGWLLIVAALFLTAIAFTIARLWLPGLENYRQDIELAASRALQHEVTIGDMRASWRGIKPVLRLGDVEIAGEGGHRLAIREVRISLDTRRYLSHQEIGFSEIDVLGVDLQVIRDADGRFHIEHFSGGTAVDLTELFRLSRLSLREAGITLTDRQSGAAPQHFSGVRVSLENSGSRHHLAGYVTSPDTLGGRVDLQAVFHGSPRSVRDWHGRIYLKAQSLALPAVPVANTARTAMKYR
ncbi:MAG TPA: hypothetical protein VET88_05410, partial [Gammaproteobacteria bacterium]|nr:hypothetical protein [Gammaproteobacteria bacterium]